MALSVLALAGCGDKQADKTGKKLILSLLILVTILKTAVKNLKIVWMPIIPAADLLDNF